MVVLGVPPGTEFGVDLNSWNTGEKFCGVKLIPPGLHFVYYSSVHLPTRTTGPRTGWFHSFGRSELVVKRWSTAGEEVVDSTEEEVERVKADLRGLDSRLGVYPYNSWSKWISLSNKINEATVNRLEPMGGKIWSMLLRQPKLEEKMLSICHSGMLSAVSSMLTAAACCVG